jgi:hypothetical protein
MLPTNGRVSLEHLLVVLRSYFDGGNKADSAQYDVVSLAAVSGTKDLWHRFEIDWKKNLRKHKAAFLHVTDAVGRMGIYEGWKEDQRDLFISDCVVIAKKHIARAIKPDRPGNYGLFPCVVSIHLKDFVAHFKANPTHPHNADQTCLRHLLATVIWWAQTKAMCTECAMFFDQGEPFLGHLIQIMQSKKAMKDAPSLAMITSKGDADSKNVPALQLADLYAWCVSHRNSVWRPQWLKDLLSDDYWLEYYDKESLGVVDMEAMQTFDSWNVPKRTPTK